MTTEIKLLNDEMLKALFKNDDTTKAFLIIDIREPSEYAREHVPGSRNVPLSELSKTDFSTEKNKTAIFYCRLGNRTRLAQADLLATGLKEIYCMEGGIEQWKRCGLPAKFNRGAPIDIMRQVQIIAGILILLGIVFAYIASSYFILLSGFVGLGLLLAGITGFCGMARLLMLLPWNKQKVTSTCTTNRR